MPSPGSWAYGTAPSRARRRTRAIARAGFRDRSRPRSEFFVTTKITPLAHRQWAQRNAAAAHALEPGDCEADQLAHAPDLALAPLAQHEAQLVVVLPRYARGPQLDAVEFESMLQQLHCLVWQRALDAHQVFLLDCRVAADQVLGDAAVLREHDESGGIDVEAPRRCESAQVAGLEPGRRRVVGPAVLGFDQRHRRRVTILGLAGDVADRLVQQDGHELALVVRRRPIDVDARVRRHAHAERGDDVAIDLHPSVLDPIVGFASRAKPELAHAFRKTRIVGIFVTRRA